MTKKTLEKALALGTKTKWGKIGSIIFTKGERYYMMVGRFGDVALMPASVVQAEKEVG